MTEAVNAHGVPCDFCGLPIALYWVRGDGLMAVHRVAGRLRPCRPQKASKAVASARN